ncbi:SGNH/GDSL hydrolase family protein [Collimonas sp.]|uniref:SGNH/GDSL hydrolase family protein n=1 Tax=Collimonas sp. TaxID=1963772 RepID=UPI002D05B9E0|nr:SGNH/GDSL hydrolase family protein [Collimonas sp.]HWW08503.1 SGNH/GDSL hydrolase family protein [Collimonas sp.]
MSRMLSVCGVMVGVMLMACASAAPARPFSRIVVFGDSYSDAGNANGSQALSRSLLQPNGPVAVDAALSQVEAPDRVHYWQGHWSNGKTAVEKLAARYKIALDDYAVGGAKSDAGNYYTWLTPYIKTGVLGQIERFKKTLGSKAGDPDALCVIFISANDLFLYVDSNVADSSAMPLTTSALQALADQSVANIDTALQALTALGAKRVMVVGVPDLSLLPWARGQNFQGLVKKPVNFVNESKTFQDRINSRLASELPSSAHRLGIQVYYFDYLAASVEIRKNAVKNGYRNLTDACQPGGSTGNFRAACSNPDSYYFWDEYHPTRRTHQLIANAMYKALERRP